MARDAAPTVDTAPGRWMAVVGPDMWLLADVDPALPVSIRCEQLIASGADEDLVLTALMQAGFRTVGNFVLARRSDNGVHGVVRGAARLELRMRESGALRMEPLGGADWVDRIVPGRPYDIRLVARTGDAGSTPHPDASGRFLAGAITVLFDDAADPTTPTTPTAPTAPTDPTALASSGLITSDDLSWTRAARLPRPSTNEPADLRSSRLAPIVVPAGAVVCAAASPHVNPATATTCYVCGAAVPGEIARSSFRVQPTSGPPPPPSSSPPSSPSPSSGATT